MYRERQSILQYTPGAFSVQYEKLEPVQQPVYQYNCTEDSQGLHLNITCAGTVQDKAMRYRLVYTKSDRRLLEANSIR